ncbi:MAG: hypothetical protein II510_00475 [Erysipelotrichales bacterium]|nr:hypothetical protein [Erysipelotrichales bacterium]
MLDQKMTAKDRSYAAALNGDLNAREMLFGYLEPKLSFLCGTMTQKPELTEGILQEFFDTAYETRYENYREFESTAMRFVMEKAVSAIPEEPIGVLENAEQEYMFSIAEEEIAYDAFERDMILDNVFSALPSPFREILLMRHYEKLSFKKIAAIKQIKLKEAQELVQTAEFFAAKEIEHTDTECFGRDPLELFRILLEEKRSGRAHRAKTKPEESAAETLIETAEVLPVDKDAEIAVQKAAKEKARTIVGYARRMTLALALLIALAVALPMHAGYGKKEDAKKEMSYMNLLQSLRITFEEDAEGEIQDFEYGGEAFFARNLIKTHKGTLEILGDTKIDPSVIRDYETVYRLSAEDEYGQKASWDVVRHYSIRDTKAPVIDLSAETLEIYSGDPFDPAANIARVYDEVDGDFVYVKEEPGVLEEAEDGRLYDAGWYTVSGEVDTLHKGTYDVQVVASDNHGNRSETSYKVSVILLWEGARDTSITRGTRASNKIYIYNLLTKELGMTRAAACGVLANICQESSFRPEAYDDAWDGTPYVGLCQWGGGRLNGLYSFCERNGYDAGSLEGQTRYIIYELRGTYRFVLDRMMACPNTARGAFDAAEIFRSQYEVSAFTATISQTAAAYFVNE